MKQVEKQDQAKGDDDPKDKIADASGHGPAYAGPGPPSILVRGQTVPLLSRGHW